MTIQDTNGFPDGVPAKASPTLLDILYMSDVADGGKVKKAVAGNLPFLPLAGGTMTGFLTLNADPATNLEAATKQYVDAAAGGGAPKTATYITQTPDATLTNEQALSLLTTGLMKNTTVTGVISIAVQGVDYYEPGGTKVTLADGGTNAGLVASNGGIVYSTATAMAILAATATARQMLQSGASGAPAWSTSTWPATTTVNRILYSSATNVVDEIITANNGILVTSAGGVPSIGTAIPNGVTATTQAANDNSTKIATTAYADNVATAGGGQVLLGSASGGGATIDFTSLLSSTYDNYELVVEGLLPATNATTLQLRIGTGAGVFQVTNYSGNVYANVGGTTFASGNTAIDCNPQTRLSNVANRVSAFHFTISNANAATDKTIIGLGGYWDSTATADANTIITGRWQGSSVITSLRLLISTGNINATVKLFGLKN